jgi:hypothetical protein
VKQEESDQPAPNERFRAPTIVATGARSRGARKAARGWLARGSAPLFDDPVVLAIIIPMSHCLTDGACAPACVPGEMGGGGAPAATTSPGDAPAGGACDNPEDQAIMSSGLTTAAQSCGFSCFTSATADCHGACVANETGLSLACSACWGATIHCDASTCLPQCLEPASLACSDCNDQSCTPAFRSWAGVD